VGGLDVMIELMEVIALVFGVPVLLFGLMLLLARFEASLVQPGERAAKVVELLHSADAPEEVEQQTARMLEVVVPAGPRDDEEGSGAP
jgi:hypothetical protein